MKKMFTITLLFLLTGAITPDSFLRNRQRVWEILSNLPIEKTDWRHDDLKDYLINWEKELFKTPIGYVNSIRDYDTPSMYYSDPSRIELDSSKFTAADDVNHCVEHELSHAAFMGNLNVPSWLLWLGINISNAKSGDELPYEIIVRAVCVRRDIIDYYGLSLNATITERQIDDYIQCKDKMDFGLEWLLQTTKEGYLIHLLNFENGWLIKERYETTQIKFYNNLKQQS